MSTPNETHDPQLMSWVETANLANGEFPIQNLPHGVFRVRGATEGFRGGVAIGDMILDMHKACSLGVFKGPDADAAAKAAQPTLNALMASGPHAWSGLRLALSRALRVGAPEACILRNCLVSQSGAEFGVPAQIGDYTDFFASQYHAFNVGQIFAPANPLYPNFKWLPIAYHGRASSIEVSGGSFYRPYGQRRPVAGSDVPAFGPSTSVDYELELAAFMGPGNARGEPIPIDQAEQHIFGVCLLNDWSARDVQGWESMPLGPFLAKNFLTTISPWIVTMEALAPFRVPLVRAESDPPTLPYLRATRAGENGGLDIQLEAWLLTPKTGDQEVRLSRTSAKHTYWSLAQMVAHHTEGGCNLRPGDMLGTGTQSGPARGEEGCLLELSRGGKEPVDLGNGESRRFLEDGDTVVLRGWCERHGFRRIGFGECRGQLMPARKALREYVR